METLSLSESSSDVLATQTNRLASRYGSAYSTASAIIGLGSFLRVLGVLAGVAVAGWDVMLVISVSQSISSQSMIGIAGGVLFGLVVAVLGFTLGALVMAIGQILKAVLDSAVNTSPLLTNERKAEMMGL